MPKGCSHSCQRWRLQPGGGKTLVCAREALVGSAGGGGGADRAAQSGDFAARHRKIGVPHCCRLVRGAAGPGTEAGASLGNPPPASSASRTAHSCHARAMSDCRVGDAESRSASGEPVRRSAARGTLSVVRGLQAGSLSDLLSGVIESRTARQEHRTPVTAGWKVPPAGAAQRAGQAAAPPSGAAVACRPAMRIPPHRLVNTGPRRGHNIAAR